MWRIALMQPLLPSSMWCIALTQPLLPFCTQFIALTRPLLPCKNWRIALTAAPAPFVHTQIAMPLADGRCYQRLAMSPTGVIAASYQGTVHFISRCAAVLGHLHDAFQRS